MLGQRIAFFSDPKVPIYKFQDVLQCLSFFQTHMHAVSVLRDGFWIREASAYRERVWVSSPLSKFWVAVWINTVKMHLWSTERQKLLEEWDSHCANTFYWKKIIYFT